MNNKKVRVTVKFYAYLAKTMQKSEITMLVGENIEETLDQIKCYVKDKIKTYENIIILHNDRTVSASINNGYIVKENDCFKIFPMISGG